MTQEYAAELLAVSIDSLRDYEHDKTVPKLDIVKKMRIIYSSPHLLYMHVEKLTDDDILPKLERKSFSENVLCLEDDLLELTYGLKELRKIARDNKVAVDEKEKFNDIMQKAKLVMQSIINLQYMEE